MRIAFLTNEFVIEKPDAGGLGNYLNRITQVLHKNGHDVEIFATRHYTTTPKLIDHNGIKVHHVPVGKSKLMKLINFFDRWILKTPYGGMVYNFGIPYSLAKAFHKREKEITFDFVQSASYAAAGLFVERSKNRRHLIRLSSIIKENLIQDRQYRGIGAHLLVWMEHMALKKADRVYSPSLFTASNYPLKGNKKIHVIRPPFFLEVHPAESIDEQLPERYFIHFGSIGSLKGSDILAKALPIVWKVCPDFKMIWVGKERTSGEMMQYRFQWGDENSRKITWYDGLQKPKLYHMLQKAEVAVLPSKIDNLPNTLLESLFFKVPVIGSNGASIDELIQEGRNGTLVDIGDVEGLALAIIKAWRKEAEWLPEGFMELDELKKFAPLEAASRLIEFACYSSS